MISSSLNFSSSIHIPYASSYIKQIFFNLSLYCSKSIFNASLISSSDCNLTDSSEIMISKHLANLIYSFKKNTILILILNNFFKLIFKDYEHILLISAQF